MPDVDKLEAGSKKKSSMVKWVILIILLLGLGGGGYFAYLKFFADKPGSAESASEEQAQADKDGAKKNEMVRNVTLPTFLVNLADPLGRRYIKLTLDVEVDGPETEKKLDASQAKIRDAMILLLSSKSYADLATLESKQLLKMEIVNQLNLILGPNKVKNVYFTEMVIQ